MRNSTSRPRPGASAPCTQEDLIAWRGGDRRAVRRDGPEAFGRRTSVGRIDEPGAERSCRGQRQRERCHATLSETLADPCGCMSIMRRCLLFGILLAAVFTAPASAKVPKGPSGDAFYTYAKPLPSKHGAALWMRKLSGQAALKGGSSTLLLYRSTSFDGKAVSASAVLTVPKGKAPKGGWPIVSWAHGTTGIADQCAPSRANVQQGYDHPLMQRWLKAGYAVVRTDYQGLGTAGPHPYLIGDAEGHDVLDGVIAARQADGDIANDVAVAGHSQGGQAALFAASLAPKYAPALKVKGTVAFAPVSHLGEQGAALRAVDTTGLTALAAMILRGIDIANPQLNVQSL